MCACGTDTTIAPSGHGGSSSESAGAGPPAARAAPPPGARALRVEQAARAPGRGAGGAGGATTGSTGAQGGGTTTGSGGSAACVTGDLEECYSGDPATKGVGSCKAGTRACADGKWGDCTGQILPIQETCNGRDDDCDGMLGSGLECLDGVMAACYTGPPETLNIGVCIGGVMTWMNGLWGPCMGEIVPSAETCNGEDDDCDRVIDDGVRCN